MVDLRLATGRPLDVVGGVEVGGSGCEWEGERQGELAGRTLEEFKDERVEDEEEDEGALEELIGELRTLGGEETFVGLVGIRMRFSWVDVVRSDCEFRGVDFL